MQAIWMRAMSYAEDCFAVLPAALLAGAVYLAARHLWLKRSGRPRLGWGEEGSRLLLVCWLTALLALVWMPGNFWAVLKAKLGGGYPYPYEVQWFSGEFAFVPSFRNLWQAAANGLLYLPLGLLLPVVWKRAGGLSVTAAGLALSLVTELGQPVVGRSFDTADLIVNTLGAAAGYLLFAAARGIASRFHKITQKG